MKIEKGRRVTLKVDLSVAGGQQLEKSTVEFIQGSGKLLPALEAVIEGLEKGAVPHYLPNENPFLKDIRNRYGLPVDQPTAGPATMYPEYLKQLRPSEWTAGGKKALLDPNARGGER